MSPNPKPRPAARAARAPRQAKRTIYDVADLAGASASTVSAVMSGTWRSRRISAATADRVADAAAEIGYSPNLQARGLRRARSGLVGMILPEYENRYFGQLAQAFSLHVRACGQLPVIVATDRDPAEEVQSVRMLLDHSVESLVLAGASDPDRLSELCRAARLRHVFIDQPCEGATSVITDNRRGMERLALALLGALDRRGAPARALAFLGGDARLPATRERIEGYREALDREGLPFDPARLMTCGYRPEEAERALRAFYAGQGRLPSGLVVNSISAFEGALRVLSDLPDAEVARCVIGCFDYSPFLTRLRYPVWMIRQSSEALMARAFAHLGGEADAGGVERIMPLLIEPS